MYTKAQIKSAIDSVNEIFMSNYDTAVEDYEEILQITLNEFCVVGDTVRVSFEADSEHAYETVIGQIEVDADLFETGTENLASEILFLVEENVYGRMDPHNFVG